MKEELQHILLYSSRTFDSIIDGFSTKEGLTIFEIDFRWRICSWWDGKHIAHSYADLERWLCFRNDEKYAHLPFIGGALGWISYDQGIEGEDQPQTQNSIDPMIFWSSSGAICYDLISGVYHIIGSSSFCVEAKKGFQHAASETPPSPISIPPPSSKQKEHYIHSVKTLLNEIREGRVYQANLSWKSAPFTMKTPLTHLLGQLESHQNSVADLCSPIKFLLVEWPKVKR